MTKNLFRILLFLLLPLAGQAKDADSLRVLWVGNSYTYYNDMPAIVQQIAATQKVKVSCTRFLKGGERFSGHLTNQKLLKALAAGGSADLVRLSVGIEDPADILADLEQALALV